ncbi:MAG: dynamin family protein [Burkholderiales bacterium]|nr:dynamin family protein [Burkholderiales bacterium]
MSQLESLVAQYSQWRDQLRAGIEAYHAWLDSHGHVDIQRSLRLYDLAESLRNDRMTLAFLAEFSRGKTELINSIFFSDFKQRLLPSNVGRTTMCPTEIFHDAAEEPYIRLLPIETRKSDETIAALKHKPIEWVKVKLNLDNFEELQKALSTLAQSKSVAIEEADALGLLVEGDIFTTTVIKRRVSRVDIPAWRHAMINFPHPLLKSGLVILDTPGLNALGTEPELTVSMIPNAHAVLFLLAMDTGVTKSDLEVWQKFVQGKVARSLAVLNKIDLMWDDLKSETDIETNIQRQIDETAHILDLPRNHVIAISAQKALLAKIRSDSVLLERSRIKQLERLLAEEIVPAKQEILRAAVYREIGTMVEGSLEGVRSALVSTSSELQELSQLSGKNRDLARAMLGRLEQDKTVYQQNMEAFKTNYGVALKQGHQLLGTLSDDELDRMLSENQKSIEGSWTTAGLMKSMNALFDKFGEEANKILAFATEAKKFVDGVYQTFHEKHGFPKLSPPSLNLEKHILKMNTLRDVTDKFCRDPVNVMTEKHFLVRKFYGGLVAEAKTVFQQVRGEFEAWLKGALVPLSMQLRDHQKLLERRVESIRKISGDISSLQDRAKLLESSRADLQKQVDELSHIKTVIAGHSEKPRAKVA